jgi:hypothetical protein
MTTANEPESLSGEEALLSDRQVELAEEQATRTATALKFFANELKQACARLRDAI